MVRTKHKDSEPLTLDSIFWNWNKWHLPWRGGTVMVLKQATQLYRLGGEGHVYNFHPGDELTYKGFRIIPRVGSGMATNATTNELHIRYFERGGLTYYSDNRWIIDAFHKPDWWEADRDKFIHEWCRVHCEEVPRAYLSRPA